ncbi:hypothetical protein GCM10009654_19290 [Streptomyces hebeiensis]|uniref:Secreted protein n=1 Tax=Streptomyces hebeiensis TaxID=229486 RepID=A0ABN1UQ90_9ACTN
MHRKKALSLGIVTSAVAADALAGVSAVDLGRRPGRPRRLPDHRPHLRERRGDHVPDHREAPGQDLACPAEQPSGKSGAQPGA